jgi:hypothetical protein
LPRRRGNASKKGGGDVGRLKAVNEDGCGVHTQLMPKSLRSIQT